MWRKLLIKIYSKENCTISLFGVGILILLSCLISIIAIKKCIVARKPKNTTCIPPEDITLATAACT